tara:strand:- start:342 stop:539 length:198 start_codon:yes stop_codon:yes gene_type:complete
MQDTITQYLYEVIYSKNNELFYEQLYSNSEDSAENSFLLKRKDLTGDNLRSIYLIKEYKNANKNN